MAATAVEVAKGVATQLATGAFSQKVRVERKYLSNKQLAELYPDDGHNDLNENIVMVRPVSRSADPNSRTHILEEVGIAVTLTRRAAVTDTEEIDGLLSLLEELCDRARQLVEAGTIRAAWVRMTGEPMLNDEALFENDIFAASTTLFYRTVRT